MKRLTIYIAYIAILFVVVNIAGRAFLTSYNIDVTEDKIFTLSEGSKNIIKNLEQPIEIKFFFSNKIASSVPVVKAYAARIEGLLERYSRNSNGKITLKTIEPKSFSAEEDEALSLGLQAIKADNKGTKAYFGLSMTNADGKSRVIPFFALDKEKFLEYELTRAIYELNNPKKTKITLLSSLNMEGVSMMGIPGLPKGDNWLILEQLEQSFEVNKLDYSNITKISDDTDILVLIQPQDLSEDTLYAIDQFVLSGGRAIIFADPYFESDAAGDIENRNFSNKFNILLNNWGVNIRNDLIIGDHNLARKYNKQVDGIEDWNLVNYIAWLRLNEANINRNEVATSDLKNINISTASAIGRLNNNENISIIPLLQTSKNSGIISLENIASSPTPNPNDILANFSPDDHRYTLAARLHGFVDSAFEKKPTQNSSHLTRSTQPINVVLVTDADMLTDDNWAKIHNVQGYRLLTQTADNSSFVINLLDYLGGTGDLISLRSRSSADRPFTKVDQIKRKAEDQFLAKELELKKKLALAEKKLLQLKQSTQMQTSDTESKKANFKAKQEIEIKTLNKGIVAIRKELRSVQAELHGDIVFLGNILKFINIWLMPILIGCFAIFFFAMKKRRGGF